jgi:hypothetical protein
LLGQITDEWYATQRYQIAIGNPAYSLFGHNCEHFARFVATGIPESKQLQAVGWVAGLAVLVPAGASAELQRPRRRRRARSALAAWPSPCRREVLTTFQGYFPGKDLAR